VEQVSAAISGQELEREVAGLYHLHARELHRFASLILRRQDGAADAVQEAFLRYFAERRCGGAIENPRAWLYRVLHNYLLDRQGRASVTREVTSDGLADPMDVAQNPETRLAHSQAAQQLAEVLTGREFECLRLRAEGLSYEEVAAALGIRSGTVGALLTRVRRKLLDPSSNRQSVQMGVAEALGSLLHEGGSYSS
jgi:RNA polymerase sigma-70 factor (ECF subfamily)